MKAPLKEAIALEYGKRKTPIVSAKGEDELAQRIAAMQSMQQTLAHLVHCCHGDERPECPILDDLAGAKQGH